MQRLIYIRARLTGLLLLLLISSGMKDVDAQSFYHEAPMLTELSASGAIPGVDDRLPVLPMIVQPETETGTYGGTLMVLESSQEAAALNNIIGYEPLMRWDSQWLRPVENLAQSVEASEDAMTYTFHLREGIRWSDGAPFTANDILFAFEDVLLNPEIRQSAPLWLRSGGEPATVTKVDDYTITFSFKAPNGLFLLRLANNAGTDLTRYPRHYLEQFLPAYNNDMDGLVKERRFDTWVNLFKDVIQPRNVELPVLTAWQVTRIDETIVAERNPYYWKIDPDFNQLPYLDKVVFQPVNSLEAYTAAIATQPNVAVLVFDDEFKNFSIDDADNAALRAVDLISANSTSLALGLNLNHPDPVLQAAFSDKNFRIGLSYAINRPALVDQVYGGKTRAYQVAPRPESPFFSEQMAYQYTEYNVELANQTLDAAGYRERDTDGYRLAPDGTRVSFALQTSSPSIATHQIIEQVAADWQAVGIDVVVEVYEGDEVEAYNELLYAGAQDSYLSEAVGGLDVMMQPSYYFPFHPFASFYASGWANWNINPPFGTPVEPPEAIQQQMALYAELQTTVDPDRQAVLMMDLLKISADEFLVIGTVLDPGRRLFVSSNLVNVPSIMPRAFDYPAPAPSNPAQYFIHSGS